MRKYLLVVIAASFAWPATSAWAAVTETDGFRRVSAKSMAGVFQNEDIDDPADVTDDSTSGVFTEVLDTSASGPGATATALASQNSEIANGAYSGTLLASANAENTGGQTADGSATCDYSVGFTVDQPTDFDLTTSVEAARSGSGGSAIARLQVFEDWGFPPVVNVEQTDGSTIDYSATFTAQPGKYYVLTVFTDASANRTFNPGTASADATVTFTLAVAGEVLFGACCDDSTGICTDTVEEADCPPPLRFASDTLCIDLDPQCGAPIPTVSEWGLIAMALLMLAAGAYVVRHKRETASGQ